MGYEDAVNKSLSRRLSLSKRTHMLKTFYYYYHLFYKNIFKDNDSYFTAKLALTASESLFVVSVIDISCAYFFCWSLNRYYMAAITVIILAYNASFFLAQMKRKILKKINLSFLKVIVCLL